jgi:ribosomal-protein-alanine N-acetyltransferase
MAQLQLAATHTSDITPILEIDQHSFAWPWNRICFAGELASSSGCNYTLKYVDQTNAQSVIGYIICRLVNQELHILRIAVKPGWRGYGLATRLLARAFDQAARQGASAAFLEVRPSNRPARAFYDRRGFRLIGKKPGYYTDTREDALVLMKNLKEDL